MAVVVAYNELAEKFNYSKSFTKEEAEEKLKIMISRLEASCNLSFDAALQALQICKSDVSGDRVVRTANDLDKNLIEANKIVSCILKSQSELFSRGTGLGIRRPPPRETYKHTKYQASDGAKKEATHEIHPPSSAWRSSYSFPSALRKETAHDGKPSHRGRPKRLTDDKIAEIEKRWGNGETVVDLAKEYGVRWAYIYRVCERPKHVEQSTNKTETTYTSKVRSKIEQNMDSIISDKIGGMSYNALAKKYEASVGHLHLIIKEAIERRIEAGDKSAVELKMKLSKRVDAVVKDQHDVLKPPRNMVDHKTIEKIFAKHELGDDNLKAITKSYNTNVRHLMRTLVYKVKVLSEEPASTDPQELAREAGLNKNKQQSQGSRAIPESIMAALMAKVDPTIAKDIEFVYGIEYEKSVLIAALYMIKGLSSAYAARYAGVGAGKVDKAFAYLGHKNAPQSDVNIEAMPTKPRGGAGANTRASTTDISTPGYVNLAHVRQYETMKEGDSRRAKEAQRLEQLVSYIAKQIAKEAEVEQGTIIPAIKHHMHGGAALLSELWKSGLGTKKSVAVAKLIKKKVPVDPNSAYIETFLAQNGVN